MTHDQANKRRGRSKKAEGAAPPGPDERDTLIERLERALAEEREHTETLRKSVEDLRFKAAILETSYTTQLEDARQRADKAEGELADLRNRMVTLESAHEDAMQLLAEARAELDRAPDQRGRLRKALLQIDSNGQGGAESQLEEGSGTINKLMSDPSWAQEDQPGDDEEASPAEHEPSGQDAPAEDLIDPELVFAVEGEDKT